MNFERHQESGKTGKKLLYSCTILALKIFATSYGAFLICLNTIIIPSALFKDLTNEKWEHATNVNIKALGKNRTRELVKLPIGKKFLDVNELIK